VSIVFKVAELFGLALISSVKFLYGPTAIYLAGYSFWQTILVSCLGGFAGVFLFFKTGQFISDWWIRRFGESKKPKKKFNKRNRAFIKDYMDWLLLLHALFLFLSDVC
jgi:membrane protein DedA with SNARE-associated domain